MTSERFWHCLLPAPGKVGSPRQIGGSPGALSSLTAQESPPAAHRAAGLSSPTAFIYCLPALSCSNQCITKFHSEAKKQSTEKKKKGFSSPRPRQFLFPSLLSSLVSLRHFANNCIHLHTALLTKHNSLRWLMVCIIRKASSRRFVPADFQTNYTGYETKSWRPRIRTSCV